MSRYPQEDPVIGLTNDQRSPPLGLSYSSSEGTLQTCCDLSDYPNRHENYEQVSEAKGKFLLYFSSNSFLKNKMAEKKQLDMKIPPLKIDGDSKQQYQTNSSGMSARPMKFTQRSKGETEFHRALKTDRSIKYLGGLDAQNEQGMKHAEYNPKKEIESHLNFKISPRKRASENYDRKVIAPKNYHSDQKPSTASAMELNLFEPRYDEEQPRQKRLMVHNSTSNIHYVSYDDPIKKPVEKKDLMTKYKGNADSTTSHSSSRGYFSRKIYDSPTRIRPNPLTLEDFSQLKKLGKGKFGQVFLVKHKKLGFICAMKVVQKEKVIKNNVMDQFCNEIKIQCYLRHPHLVTLYGIFSDSDNIYLLMELLCDNTLYREMRSQRKHEEDTVSLWLKQICSGVEYMHREKVMHRDIKPQNIIIHSGVAKIADFGWAAYYADQSRTTFCGTPAYLSPQILSETQYTQKIDVWCLGLLTYQMLVGNLPFKIRFEKDLKKITNQNIAFPLECNISEATKQFILMALQKDPERRGDIDNLLHHPFLQFDLKEALDWGRVEGQCDRLGLFNQHKVSSLDVIKGYKRELKETTLPRK